LIDSKSTNACIAKNPKEESFGFLNLNWVQLKKNRSVLKNRRALTYILFLSSQSINITIMSLSTNIMTALKDAMRSKDQTALTALRAVKSAILLAQTESGSKEELTEEQELKILQKQVKQRKDSAAIYIEQGREDLAEPELAEAKVISQFLPEAMSEEAIAKVVEDVINKTGANGMKDMGKVMGVVSAQLAGKADGKTISNIVKSKLA